MDFGTIPFQRCMTGDYFNYSEESNMNKKYLRAKCVSVDHYMGIIQESLEQNKYLLLSKKMDNSGLAFGSRQEVNHGC